MRRVRLPIDCRNCCSAASEVQKGKLKLSVISERGKEAVIAILGPGHFFGEGCLTGHGLRVATTMAIYECTITRIDKAAMIATLHNETDFSELFMSYLLARNSRIEEDLVDQLFNSSERRLARLLLLLRISAKKGGRCSWQYLSCPTELGACGDDRSELFHSLLRQRRAIRHSRDQVRLVDDG
jgi:hypothetical protein